MAAEDCPVGGLPWYLKWLSPTEFLKNLVFKVFHLDKIPGLRNIVQWFTKPKGFVPKGTLATLSSLKGIRPGILSRLNPSNWKIFNKKANASAEDDEKFQAGEPYGDPKVVSTGLVEDLRAVGFTAATKDLETLIGVFKAKGKPQNDREMTMEKMIALTASLPRTSATRKKLSGVIVDTLWSSLQHPPLTYMGDKFQYRTPDGSYNNPMNPDLGKAGSPYARSVQRLKSLHGVPPDPGLLFDLLMARSDDTFKENPAGISSVLFYHATIIIHDIFNTSRIDSNISNTSSYLDLSPLYGSNIEEQMAVRLGERGLLKPDTFHEKRLIGQPPGVNAMLVMYNRFHNYVADALLQINEGGRFTLPDTSKMAAEKKKEALDKQDHDLFNTARLVVGGLYVNISLHDYLRGLTNSHHSATDWTLDPRIAASRLFDPDGVPRGMGNQVSAEFNLLYRFHSIISRRDEKWLNEFLATLFPGSNKALDELTPAEFVRGLAAFEASIPKDPSKREFGGLKRGADGRFADADLVRTMTESMEDPAGLFGARMVPKFLKIVEVTGILTARKWRLGSLNELRDFFKLRRHATFEDVNPDPAVADLLRKLYDHPDMVEMYPGMFLEDAKPRLDPGCGGCPPYTVGRAVFSDAVTLVRSDRFCTLDFTSSALTAWGMNEIKPDLDVLGGSKFYQLFQRALPGWYPYNSLHIMQPMFTRKMNEQIATELGTIGDYSPKGPAPPPRPIILTKHSTITKMLADQANFHVPWVGLEDLFPGKKSFMAYMLSGDTAANLAQRKLVQSIVYTPSEFARLLADTALAHGRDLLKRESLDLHHKDLQQLDIVRDVAIPLNTRLIADLWCQDLLTDENPKGTLTTPALYKYLMDVRTFGFNNHDPALAWRRRLWARQAAEAIIPSAIKAVKEGTASPHLLGRLGSGIKSGFAKLPLVGRLVKPAHKEAGSLRWYGNGVAKELMAAGKTVEETADICWLSAVAGVGAPISLFADVLSYFLQPANAHHWEAIQELTTSPNREASDKTLRQYVLEANRLNSELRGARVCVGSTKIDGQTFNPGDVIVTMFSRACKDPEAVPDPLKFKLDRPDSAYIHWGSGPHQCLGREISLSIVMSLIKISAELKNLRPAPGQMGVLKSVMIGTNKTYLNDSWSWMTQDPTTWKIHYEGYGKGVYRKDAFAAAEGSDLNAIAYDLVNQGLVKPRGETTAAPKKALVANGVEDGEAPATNGVSPAKAPAPATNGAEPAKPDGGWSFDNVPDDSVKPPSPAVDGKDTEADGAPTPDPAKEEEKEPDEPEKPDVLRTGRLAKKADDGSETGLGDYTVPITFTTPHKTSPKILLGFSALGLERKGDSAPSFHQEAQNVTSEGFNLAVRVQSGVLRELESVWVEVPDDDKHRNVLVGTWDSGKLPGKPSSDGRTVESPFFPYKNFGDGTEPAQGGKRTVIPWIAGFAFDDAAAKDEPMGVKVMGTHGTKDDQPGVTVGFSTPSGEVKTLPKWVRVSVLTFLPNDKAHGLSRGSCKAEFPSQDSDSVTVLSTSNAPVSPVAGIDMFEYLAETDGIRLRVVDRQKEPDEAKYSLESWDEPLVYEMSAAIVKAPKVD
ncbi:putative prostaglandin g h synthase 2 cyclooxygenase pgh2 cox2 [Neofusicoccum parvum]|nr:putative prostaglandin g h synthase 2 cyclooxygenase pgh2 cox2 [Neofusicoccum parvum]